jgi:hypothetical protein
MGYKKLNGLIIGNKGSPGPAGFGFFFRLILTGEGGVLPGGKPQGGTGLIAVPRKKPKVLREPVGGFVGFPDFPDQGILQSFKRRGAVKQNGENRPQAQESKNTLRRFEKREN